MTRSMGLAACAGAMALLAGAASAATTASAVIQVDSLSVSGDKPFVLLNDNGDIVAHVGPDGSAASANQSLTISGNTTATASLPTGSASANSAIANLPNGTQQSFVLVGNIGGQSAVNVGAGQSDTALGSSGPIFEFEAPSASAANPITLTFSMTVQGSMSGSADPLGHFQNGVEAFFSVQSNASPFPFVPAASFSESQSGGPGDSDSVAFGPTVFTGQVVLDSSADSFFQAFAQATSTADDLGTPAGGVPEPAAWALMLLGFAGLGASLRRRQAALRPKPAA